MNDSSGISPRTNLVLSILILAGCVAAWLATDTLPSGLRVDPLGPAYYPRFVLLGLGALALALLVNSLRELRRAPATNTPPSREIASEPIQATVAKELEDEGGVGAALVDEQEMPPVSYPRLFAVFGLSLTYALLLNALGYFISTMLYVLLLLLLLRVRKPLVLALCAIGTPLVLDALFGRLLGIPLPGGLLDAIPMPF